MRHAPITTLLMLLALATAVSACGGGGAKRGGIPPAPPVEEKPVEDPTKDKFETLGENPKWIPLREMFAGFKEQKIENLANPLLTNHVVFVEPPPLPERNKKKDEVPVSPLERGGFDRNKDKDKRAIAPLKQYKLVMLLTGTANPKAVVIGPQGRRFVLRRNDPLGSEGGRVRAILQYEMLVSVPNEKRPRKVSIEPPLAKIASGEYAPDDFSF